MVEVHFIVASTGTSDSPDVRPIRDAAKRRKPLTSHVDMRRDIRLAAQLVDDGLLGHARFFELVTNERGFEACHASLRVALHVGDSEDLDETFDHELTLVLSRFSDEEVFEALAVLVEDDTLARCEQMRAFLATYDERYRRGIACRFIQGDARLFGALVCTGIDGVAAVRDALKNGASHHDVEWAMSANASDEAYSRLGIGVPQSAGAASI